MAEPRDNKGRFTKGHTNQNAQNQKNDSGKEEALRLAKSGLGNKAIRKAMGNSVTVRRIRRWKQEAGLPTETGSRKRNYDQLRERYRLSDSKINKLQLWAFMSDSKCFKNGDEVRHWGNHPQVFKWQCSWARVKDRENARERNDLGFRLKKRIRSRVYRVLKGKLKSAPTLRLLGCSLEFLKAHFESQFSPGMSWDNYGLGWHIDHKTPCAAFDLTKPEHQRICFHYTNLQPLWASENISKKDKIVTHQPELSLPV